MQRYLVKPGSKVNLNEWDPNDTSAYSGDKESAKDLLSELNEKLSDLQEVLYAEHKHKILIVLQAMDTGGKDSTIRHVFDSVNPQGVRIVSFKVPTSVESDHDYLWRVHKETPGNGQIVIFNRSHYEDVLVVRVHNLVPQEVWSKRYGQINAFENMLAEEGTTIIKFFLHIDLSEQNKRLTSRLVNPNKRWKFNPGDLKERELWYEYMEAYEDVLSNTSMEWAPWYIVPANNKWYRNLVVSSILVKRLTKLDMKYPDPIEDIDKYLAELEKSP